MVNVPDGLYAAAVMETGRDCMAGDKTAEYWQNDRTCIQRKRGSHATIRVEALPPAAGENAALQTGRMRFASGGEMVAVW